MEFAGYIIIFFARVADVSLATIRTIMLMRGHKLLAGAIGFVEILIYIVALRYVFNTLNEWTSLIFYALGFSTGNIVGVWLEEKLAMGFLIMWVITQQDGVSFAAHLREQGFGVTLVSCQGKEGSYYLLNVVLERRRLQKLEKLIFQWDEKAFVTVSDARAIRGGHFITTR
ncbi:DUF2179 domain-containing protein [Anaerospora hongkongensis]|uniref:DUF2179 domain-containing protein n=1 Tax=Anaerospora hongkongensis TaxID=244830 RepID=UPI002899C2F2|nr:DUF5698 domain-containing protein [Anaerospora hongkongensis]